MSDIKSNLRAYYNEEAVLRDISPKQGWKLEVRERFLELVKAEGKQTLLELGAGAGHDSKYFMDNGVTVTAIDLSSEMVKLCKAKSIEAYEMDYYEVANIGKKFDCIWSMNSLLHVPKTELPRVLQSIESIINLSGLFYMGVYGGVDEESDFYNERASAPRFFSRFTNGALEVVLSKFFDIIDFAQYEVTKGAKAFFHNDGLHFQSVVMRKRQLV